jgi:hypothetical protein
MFVKPKYYAVYKIHVPSMTHVEMRVHLTICDALNSVCFISDNKATCGSYFSAKEILLSNSENMCQTGNE